MPLAADVVEQVARRSDRAARAIADGARPRAPSGRWLRAPAELADLGDRQDAVGHQRASAPGDRRRRCPARPPPRRARGRSGRGPPARPRTGRRGAARIAASSSGAAGGRAERRQPASSDATSWTARTCLHGPRSPRWRPYHGQVQVQPSVGRSDAILDAAGTGDPCRRARPRPPTRSGRRRPRRAAARPEAAAGAARRDRGRTAARAGRSRRPQGRSRRCRRGRAPPERLETLVAASDRSPPPAPRRPAAAPSRARPAPRRRAAAGAPSARRCSARPSPEKPRQTSGLSTIVRRAPGTSSCQPVLPSPGDGEDPQRRRVSGDPFEQAQAGEAGEPASRRHRDRGGTRRPRPAWPTQTGRFDGDFGIDRRNARAAAPSSSATGPSSAWIAWTSRNPRSQRDGSGTRRSTADAAVRLDLDGDAPTASPSSTAILDAGQRGPDPRPDVDVRRPSPDDLALVRRPAAGRPGRRRCSRPRTPRTGGGRRHTSRPDPPARRIRVSIAGGTWNRERATSPSVSSRSAATTGRSSRPRKNCGFAAGPPDVASRRRRDRPSPSSADGNA